MSFLVLSISIGHFGVSCQYIQYRPTSASSLSLSARLASALSDKRFDTVTEYEYYDDEIDDFGTTQSFSPTTTTKAATTTTKTTTTTTTTTTTPKPITSYRLMTTHRNGFRPLLNFNGNNGNTKKKTDTAIARQSNQPDSYTEASNESTFIQKQNNNNQSKQSASTQHQRNAISDVSRRSTSKEQYAQEKSAPAAIESNGGGFSRRYARFLFKLRSG